MNIENFKIRKRVAVIRDFSWWTLNMYVYIHLNIGNWRCISRNESSICIHCVLYVFYSFVNIVSIKSGFGFRSHECESVHFEHVSYEPLKSKIAVIQWNSLLFWTVVVLKQYLAMQTNKILVQKINSLHRQFYQVA